MLQEKPMRISDITRILDLTTAEVRRHVSRLNETALIQRNLDGYYHLTPYGETSLVLFQEIIYLSSNKEYFKTHTPEKIPKQYLKQIGELQNAIPLLNPMDFFHHIENLIKESKEYLWLLVDQFPINSLPSIIDALERGVQITIIEPVDRVLTPDLNSLTLEETKALRRTRHTPLVDQKMLDEINAFIYISEKKCILSFPTLDGLNDYTGFSATDNSSLTWCTELFQYFWDKSQIRIISPQSISVKREIYDGIVSKGQVTVVGKENLEVDVQAVQDAVDNFDEVILRGVFNFGPSHVKISRSVRIKGEGRENDIPTATVYKKGWSFPFIDFDSVFLVDDIEADVTIENINFTDFNCSCIRGWRAKSIYWKNVFDLFELEFRILVQVLRI